MIINKFDMENHDFNCKPLFVEHKKVKDIVGKITDIPNNKKEIRILGNQITRESRPKFFRENNLFLLPASNTAWNILKGDGYFDIPSIELIKENYFFKNKFKFETLDKSSTSESKYIFQAFNNGIINNFTSQDNLYLTLNGRKRATFSFTAYNQNLECNSIQIEIDAGYESENEVILIEAKASSNISNEVIRQLFFPRKYVSTLTNKKIRSIFFVVNDKGKSVNLYEYDFKNPNVYESIFLVDSKRYKLD